MMLNMSRLIIILVYGDLMRSCAYFSFGVYSLTKGAVETRTAFCQASGFFIQYGAETTGACIEVSSIQPSNGGLDYGVLVIAIHSALQVFRPASRGKSDGLHKYRYYIYAGALILPTLMASLAFIRSEQGYLLQGAYCTLPIRPFWYLLALTWIPRYLIALTIIGLAIAIYAYVGLEFRSFRNANQGTTITTTNSVVRTADHELVRANTDITQRILDPGRGASSIAHDISSAQRTATVVPFSHEQNLFKDTEVKDMASMQGSQKRSPGLPSNRSPAIRPILFRIPSSFAIGPLDSTPGIPQSPTPSRQHAGDIAGTVCSAPADLEPKQSPSREPFPMSSVQRHMAHQHRRIYRQLRLMFIYPIVYTLMWLIPFVHHCLQYSNFFAARPIYTIRLAGTLCMALMGLVDCLIFSIREKPWRSIATSNGTLWGSFFVWDGSRRISLSEGFTSTLGVSERSMTDSAGGSRVSRIRNSVRTSASDDFTRIAAEQARIRLDMEREERLAALNAQSKRPQRPSLTRGKGSSRRLSDFLVGAAEQE